MAILRSKQLSEAGFPHGWTERGTQERELAAALADARLLQVRQVHGAGVAFASDSSLREREADALVARLVDGAVAVGVRVADCVPILVADEASGDVAAIHAGWRGVIAGVVSAAVHGLGGNGRLIAAVGPCIGACCFEVGTDVADALAAAVPGASIVVGQSGRKAYADLRAAVRAQLEGAGVAPNGIEDVPGCTKHETRFHSFRRDGANSGRMLAAIAPRSAAQESGESHRWAGGA